MYYCRLGTSYQLTFGTIFMLFVNTLVVQSSVSGLSAGIISYHFDDNTALISLPFACANLRCHIILASFYESDLLLVSCSTYYSVPIFFGTLADFVSKFLIYKRSDSLLFMSARILLSLLSKNYRFHVLLLWILGANRTLSMIL